MAWFDPTTNSIVLRVVYDGVARVGKTSNLRMLADAFADRILCPLTAPDQGASGPTHTFDWLEFDAGHLDDRALRCQVTSVPGALALSERRMLLVSRADAIVLVSESSTRGSTSAAIMARALRDLGEPGQPPIPVVVQANKQDLPDALDIEAFRAVAAHDALVLGASAARGDGVRPSFIAALSDARARFRASQRAAETLAPPVRDAREELAWLLDREREGAPAALRAAFEAALDDVAIALN